MPDMRWKNPCSSSAHAHSYTHTLPCSKSSDTKWASRLKRAANNHKIPNRQIENAKWLPWSSGAQESFTPDAAAPTTTVTWNKNLNLSQPSIESLIQPDVTLKPFAWLPVVVTNVPALNRGAQTGRHFCDFYQSEFINSGSQDLWQQLVQEEARRFA